MLIEQPPGIYRAIFRGCIWRLPAAEKTVYLTFDDGPVPEVTPWVLDQLDAFDIPATFFCVGDNVRKYPTLYHDLLARGHRTGNHTYNHLQGLRTPHEAYLANVEQAARLIESPLFRPPHGHIWQSQLHALRKQYRIVMWDVVTRDYSPRMTPDGVFNIVRRYTRNGSIIVFHDSLKALPRLRTALPRSLEWLRNEGYHFARL